LSNIPTLDAAAPLQLEAALHLLRQAGHALPEGAPGSAAWIQQLIDALVDMSSSDALTGLANRRSFDLALARELDRVARSGESAVLLSLDIDHFKRINDTWGHAAGDEVIKTVARVLNETVRPMDTVARVGGEEFAVVLPNCPLEFGGTVAERIRRKIENTSITVGHGQQVGVTVSIGGALAPPWVRSSAGLWSQRADLQLYRAKSSGRNLVRLEPSVVSNVSAEEKNMLFALSPTQDQE
jgi:diguanylate cyclase (GGDEF)-like protein